MAPCPGVSDGTEVEIASTLRVIVLRTAEIELSHNNYQSCLTVLLILIKRPSHRKWC